MGGWHGWCDDAAGAIGRGRKRNLRSHGGNAGGGEVVVDALDGFGTSKTTTRVSLVIWVMVGLAR